VDVIELTSQNTSSGDQRAFTVRGSVIGSLASGGSYVPENSGYETTIRMEQVDGEWRITDLPDGVVFERTELRNHFQPLPVYFYRQTKRVGHRPALALRQPKLPRRAADYLAARGTIVTPCPSHDFRGARCCCFPRHRGWRIYLRRHAKYVPR